MHLFTDIQDDETLPQTIAPTTCLQTDKHSTTTEDYVPASIVTSFSVISIEPCKKYEKVTVHKSVDENDRSGEITEKDSTANRKITVISKKDVNQIKTVQLDMEQTISHEKVLNDGQMISKTTEVLTRDTTDVDNGQMISKTIEVVTRDTTDVDVRQSKKVNIESHRMNIKNLKRKEFTDVEESNEVIESVQIDYEHPLNKEVIYEGVNPMKNTIELQCNANVMEEIRHRPSISETLTFYGPKEDDMLKKRSIMVVEEDTSTEFEYDDLKTKRTNKRDAGKNKTRTDRKDTTHEQKITKQFIETTESDSLDTISSCANYIDNILLTETISPIDTEVNTVGANLSFIPNQHLSIETHIIHQTSNDMIPQVHPKLELIYELIPSVAMEIHEITTHENVITAEYKGKSYEEVKTITSTTTVTGDTAIQVQETSPFEETGLVVHERIETKNQLKPSIVSHQAAANEFTAVFENEGHFTGISSLQLTAKPSIDENRPVVQSNVECVEQTNNIIQENKLHELANIGMFQQNLNSLIVSEALESETAEDLYNTCQEKREARKSHIKKSCLVVEQLLVHDSHGILNPGIIPFDIKSTVQLESSQPIIVTDININEVTTKIPEMLSESKIAETQFESMQSVIVTDTNFRETIIPSTDIKHRSEVATQNITAAIPIEINEIIADEKEGLMTTDKMNEIHVDSSFSANYPLEILETMISDTMSDNTIRPVTFSNAEKIYPKHDSITRLEQVLGEKESCLIEKDICKSELARKTSAEVYSLVTEEVVTDEPHESLQPEAGQIAEAIKSFNLQESVYITDQQSQECTVDFTKPKLKEMNAVPDVIEQESVTVDEVLLEDKEDHLQLPKPTLVKANIKATINESVSVTGNEYFVKEGNADLNRWKSANADCKHVGAVQSFEVLETTLHESTKEIDHPEILAENSSINYVEQIAAQVSEVLISEQDSKIKIVPERADIGTILETALVSDHLNILEIQSEEKVSDLPIIDRTRTEEAITTILPQTGVIVSEISESNREEKLEVEKYIILSVAGAVETALALEVQNPMIREQVDTVEKRPVIPSIATSSVNECVAVDVSEIDLFDVTDRFQAISPKCAAAESRSNPQQAVTIIETETVSSVTDLITPDMNERTAIPSAVRSDHIFVNQIQIHEKELNFSNEIIEHQVGEKVSDVQEAVLIKEYEDLQMNGEISAMKYSAELAGTNIIPQKALEIVEHIAHTKEKSFDSKLTADVRVPQSFQLNDSILEIKETRAQSPIEDYCKPMKMETENACVEYIEQKPITVAFVSISDKETAFSRLQEPEHVAKIDHIPGHLSVIISEEFTNLQTEELKKLNVKEENVHVNLKGLNAPDVLEIIPQELEGIYNNKKLEEILPTKAIEGEYIPLLTEETDVSSPIKEFINLEIKLESLLPKFSSQKALVVEETSVQEKESNLENKLPLKNVATIGMSNGYDYINVTQTQSIETSKDFEQTPLPENKTALMKLPEPSKAAMTYSIILNEKEDIQEALKNNSQSATRVVDTNESISVYEFQAQSPLPDYDIKIMPNAEDGDFSFVSNIASCTSEVTSIERELYHSDEKQPIISLSSQMMPGMNSLQVKETVIQDSTKEFTSEQPLQFTARTDVIPHQTAIKSDIICADSEGKYVSESPLTDVATVELQVQKTQLEIMESRPESSLGLFKNVISVMGQAIQSIIPKKAVEIYSTLTNERESGIKRTEPITESVQPSITGTFSSVKISEVNIDDKEGKFIPESINEELALPGIIPFHAASTSEVLIQDKEDSHTSTQPVSQIPKCSHAPASEPIIISEIMAETNIPDHNVSHDKPCQPTSNIVVDDSLQIETVNIHEKEIHFEGKTIVKSSITVKNEPSHTVALSSGINTLESIKTLEIPHPEEKLASVSLSGQQIAEVMEQNIHDLAAILQSPTYDLSVANTLIDSNQPICISEVETGIKEDIFMEQQRPDEKSLIVHSVLVPMYLPNVHHTETSEFEGASHIEIPNMEHANIKMSCQTVAQVNESDVMDCNNYFKEDSLNVSTANLQFSENQSVSVTEVMVESKEEKYKEKQRIDAINIEPSPVIIPRVIANVYDITLNEQEEQTNVLLDAESMATLCLGEQKVAGTAETLVHEKEIDLDITIHGEKKAMKVIDENQSISISEIVLDSKESLYREPEQPISQHTTSRIVVIPRHLPDIYEIELKENESDTLTPTLDSSKATITLTGQEVVQVHESLIIEKEKILLTNEEAKSTAETAIEEMYSVSVGEIILDDKEGRCSLEIMPIEQNVKTNSVLVPLHVANVVEQSLPEKEDSVTHKSVEKDAATLSLITSSSLQLTEHIINSKEQSFDTVPNQKFKANSVIDQIMPLSVSEIETNINEISLQKHWGPVEEYLREVPIISPMYLPKVLQTNTVEQESTYVIDNKIRETARVVVNEQHAAAVQQTLVTEREKELQLMSNIYENAVQQLTQQHHLSVFEVQPGTTESNLTVVIQPEPHNLSIQAVVAPIQVPNVEYNESVEQEGFVDIFEKPFDHAASSVSENHSMMITQSDVIEREQKMLIDCNDEKVATLLFNEINSLGVEETFINLKEKDYVQKDHPTESITNTETVIYPMRVPTIKELTTQEMEAPTFIEPTNEQKVKVFMTGQPVAEINQPELQESENVLQIENTDSKNPCCIFDKKYPLSITEINVASSVGGYEISQPDEKYSSSGTVIVPLIAARIEEILIDEQGSNLYQAPVKDCNAKLLIDEQHEVETTEMVITEKEQKYTDNTDIRLKAEVTLQETNSLSITEVFTRNEAPNLISKQIPELQNLNVSKVVSPRFVADKTVTMQIEKEGDVCSLNYTKANAAISIISQIVPQVLEHILRDKEDSLQTSPNKSVEATQTLEDMKYLVVSEVVPQSTELKYEPQKIPNSCKTNPEHVITPLSVPNIEQHDLVEREITSFDVAVKSQTAIVSLSEQHAMEVSTPLTGEKEKLIIAMNEETYTATKSLREQQPLIVSELVLGCKEESCDLDIMPNSQTALTSRVIKPMYIADVQLGDAIDHEQFSDSINQTEQKASITVLPQLAMQILESFKHEKEQYFDTSNNETMAKPSFNEIQSLIVNETLSNICEGTLMIEKNPESQNTNIKTIITPRCLANVSSTECAEKELQKTVDIIEICNARVSLNEQTATQISQNISVDKEEKFNSKEIPNVENIQRSLVLAPRYLPNITQIDTVEEGIKCNLENPSSSVASVSIKEQRVAQVREEFLNDKESMLLSDEFPVEQKLKETIVILPRLLPNIEELCLSEQEKSDIYGIPQGEKAIIGVNEQTVATVSEPTCRDMEGLLIIDKLPDIQKLDQHPVITPRHLPNIEEIIVTECSKEESNDLPNKGNANVIINEHVVIQTTETVAGDKEELFVPGLISAIQNLTEELILYPRHLPNVEIVSASQNEKTEFFEKPTYGHAKIAISEQSVANITQTITDEKEGNFAQGEIPGAQTLSEQLVIAPLHLPNIAEILTSEHSKEDRFERPAAGSANVAVDEQSVVQISQTWIREKEGSFAPGEIPGVQTLSEQFVITPLHLPNIAETMTSEDSKDELFAAPTSGYANVLISEQTVVQVSQPLVEEKEGNFSQGEIPGAQTASEQLIMAPLQLPNVSETLTSELSKEELFESPISGYAKVTINEQTVVQVMQTLVEEKEGNFAQGEILGAQTLSKQLVMAPLHLPNIAEILTSEQSKEETFEKPSVGLANVAVNEQSVLQISQALIGEKEGSFAPGEIPGVQTLSEQLVITPLHLPSIAETLTSEDSKDELFASPTSGYAKLEINEHTGVQISQTLVEEKEGHFAQGEIPGAQTLSEQLIMAPLHLPNIAETLTSELSKDEKFDNPTAGIANVAVNEQPAVQISQPLTGEKEGSFAAGEIPGAQNLIEELVMAPMHLPNISETLISERSNEEIFENPIYGHANVTINEQSVVQVTQTSIEEKEGTFATGEIPGAQTVSEQLIIAPLHLPNVSETLTSELSKEELFESPISGYAKVAINEHTVVQVSQALVEEKEGTFAQGEIPGAQTLSEQLIMAPLHLPNIAETLTSELSKEERFGNPTAGFANITFDEQSVIQILQPLTAEKEGNFARGEVPGAQTLSQELVMAPLHLPNIAETLTSEESREELFESPTSGYAKVAMNEHSVVQVLQPLVEEKEGRFAKGEIPGAQTLSEQLIIAPLHLPNIDETLTSEHSNEEEFEKPTSRNATVAINDRSVVEVSQILIKEKEGSFAQGEIPGAQTISEQFVLAPLHLPSIGETLTSEYGKEEIYYTPESGKANVAINEQMVLQVSQIRTEEKEGNFTQGEIPGAQTLSEQLVMAPLHLPNIAETVTCEYGKEKIFDTPSSGKANVVINEQVVVQVSQIFAEEKEHHFEQGEIPGAQIISKQLVMAPMHLPNIFETFTSEQSNEEMFTKPTCGKANIFINEQSVVQVSQTLTEEKEGNFAEGEIPGAQIISKQLVMAPLNLPNIAETLTTEQSKEELFCAPVSEKAIFAVNEKTVVEVTQTLTEEKEGNFAEGEIPGAQILSEQLVMAPLYLPNISETMASEQSKEERFDTPVSEKANIAIKEQMVVLVTQALSEEKECSFAAGEIPGAQTVSEQLVMAPLNLPNIAETLTTEHSKEESFSAPQSEKAIVATNEKTVVEVTQTLTEEKEGNFAEGEVPGAQTLTEQLVMAPLHLPNISETMASEQSIEERFDSPAFEKANVAINEQMVVMVTQALSEEKECSFAQGEIPGAQNISEQLVMAPLNLPNIAETLTIEHSKEEIFCAPVPEKAIVTINEKTVVEVIQTLTEEKEGNFAEGEIPGAQTISELLVIAPLHLPSIAETTASEHSKEERFDSPESGKADVAIKEHMVVLVTQALSQEKECSFAQGEIPGSQTISEQVVITPLFLPNISETFSSENGNDEIFDMPLVEKPCSITSSKVDEHTVAQVTQAFSVDKEGSFEPGEIPFAQKITESVFVSSHNLPNVAEVILSEQGEESQLNFPTSEVAKMILSEQPVVMVMQPISVINQDVVISATNNENKNNVIDKGVTMVHHRPHVEEVQITEHVTDKVPEMPVVEKAMIKIETKSIALISKTLSKDTESHFNTDTIIDVNIAKNTTEPLILPTTEKTFLSEHLLERENVKLNLENATTLLVPEEMISVNKIVPIQFDHSSELENDNLDDEHTLVMKIKEKSVITQCLQTRTISVQPLSASKGVDKISQITEQPDTGTSTIDQSIHLINVQDMPLEQFSEIKELILSKPSTHANLTIDTCETMLVSQIEPFNQTGNVQEIVQPQVEKANRRQSSHEHITVSMTEIQKAPVLNASENLTETITPTIKLQETISVTSITIQESCENTETLKPTTEIAEPITGPNEHISVSNVQVHELSSEIIPQTQKTETSKLIITEVEPILVSQVSHVESSEDLEIIKPTLIKATAVSHVYQPILVSEILHEEASEKISIPSIQKDEAEIKLKPSESLTITQVHIDEKEKIFDENVALEVKATEILSPNQSIIIKEMEIEDITSSFSRISPDTAKATESLIIHDKIDVSQIRVAEASVTCDLNSSQPLKLAPISLSSSENDTLQINEITCELSPNAIIDENILELATISVIDDLQVAEQEDVLVLKAPKHDKSKIEVIEEEPDEIESTIDVCIKKPHKPKAEKLFQQKIDISESVQMVSTTEIPLVTSTVVTEIIETPENVKSTHVVPKKIKKPKEVIVPEMKQHIEENINIQTSTVQNIVKGPDEFIQSSVVEDEIIKDEKPEVVHETSDELLKNDLIVPLSEEQTENINVTMKRPKKIITQDASPTEATLAECKPEPQNVEVSFKIPKPKEQPTVVDSVDISLEKPREFVCEGIEENVEIKINKTTKKYSVDEDFVESDVLLEPEESCELSPVDSQSVNIRRRPKPKKVSMVNEEEAEFTVTKPKPAEETEILKEAFTIKEETGKEIHEIQDRIEVTLQKPETFVIEDTEENVSIKIKKPQKPISIEEDTVESKVILKPEESPEKISVIPSQEQTESVSIRRRSKVKPEKVTNEEESDITLSLPKQVIEPETVTSEFVIKGNSPEKEKIHQEIQGAVDVEINKPSEFITEEINEEVNIKMKKPAKKYSKAEDFVDSNVVIKPEDSSELSPVETVQDETVNIRRRSKQKKVSVSNDEETETTVIKLKKEIESQVIEDSFNIKIPEHEKNEYQKIEIEAEIKINEIPKFTSTETDKNVNIQMKKPVKSTTVTTELAETVVLQPEPVDETESVSIRRKGKPRKTVVINEDETNITLSKPKDSSKDEESFDELIILKTKDEPRIQKDYQEIHEDVDIETAKPREFTSEESTENVSIKMKKPAKKYSIQEEEAEGKVMIQPSEQDEDVIIIEDNEDIIRKETIVTKKKKKSKTKSIPEESFVTKAELKCGQEIDQTESTETQEVFEDVDGKFTESKESEPIPMKISEDVESPSDMQLSTLPTQPPICVPG